MNNVLKLVILSSLPLSSHCCEYEMNVVPDDSAKASFQNSIVISHSWRCNGIMHFFHFWCFWFCASNVRPWNLFLLNLKRINEDWSQTKLSLAAYFSNHFTICIFILYSCDFTGRKHLKSMPFMVVFSRILSSICHTATAL